MTLLGSGACREQDTQKIAKRVKKREKNAKNIKRKFQKMKAYKTMPAGPCGVETGWQVEKSPGWIVPDGRKHRGGPPGTRGGRGWQADSQWGRIVVV